MLPEVIVKRGETCSSQTFVFEDTCTSVTTRPGNTTAEHFQIIKSQCCKIVTSTVVNPRCYESDYGEGVNSPARVGLVQGFRRWVMSLTLAARQRDALVVSQFVSRAAAQAPICRRTGATVSSTGLAAFPRGVEESFRTDVPTLTLEQVSGHPKFI